VVEQFITNFNKSPGISESEDAIVGLKLQVAKMFTVRPLLSINAENSLELNVPITVRSEIRPDKPERIAFSTVIGLQLNVVEEHGVSQLEVVES